MAKASNALLLPHASCPVLAHILVQASKPLRLIQHAAQHMKLIALHTYATSEPHRRDVLLDDGLCERRQRGMSQAASSAQ